MGENVEIVDYRQTTIYLVSFGVVKQSEIPIWIPPFSVYILIVLSYNIQYTNYNIHKFQG